MLNKYIVCYDISEPRRLQKVHRYVSNEAEFLQKSVYQLYANSKSLESFIRTIEKIICVDSDDVRIYPLSPQTKVEVWGKHGRCFGVHVLE